MRTTVAKAIVKFLERAGVEVAAGCNGHGNWAFLDAVQHESRIRGIQTTCEDAAVHLADGYLENAQEGAARRGLHHGRPGQP